MFEHTGVVMCIWVVIGTLRAIVYCCFQFVCVSVSQCVWLCLLVDDCVIVCVCLHLGDLVWAYLRVWDGVCVCERENLWASVLYIPHLWLCDCLFQCFFGREALKECVCVSVWCCRPLESTHTCCCVNLVYLCILCTHTYIYIHNVVNSTICKVNMLQSLCVQVCSTLVFLLLWLGVSVLDWISWGH